MKRRLLKGTSLCLTISANGEQCTLERGHKKRHDFPERRFPEIKIEQSFVCSCTCAFPLETDARLHERAIQLARDLNSIDLDTGSCENCGNNGKLNPCDWAKRVVLGTTIIHLALAMEGLLREKQRSVKKLEQAEKKGTEKLIKGGLKVLKARSAFAQLSKARK